MNFKSKQTGKKYASLSKSNKTTNIDSHKQFRVLLIQRIHSAIKKIKTKIQLQLQPTTAVITIKISINAINILLLAETAARGPYP